MQINEGGYYMKKILALMLLISSLMLVGCEGDILNPIEPGEPIKSGEQIVYSENSGINVVPSLKDEITADSAWCATFQLVWNDLKNELVKQDIKFIPQLEMVENLNQETFTEEMISSEYYYKNFGPSTYDLKAEIEKGIKDKFDESSDVLDLVQWYNAEDLPDGHNYYTFYTMLKREFEFPKVFSKLQNGKFGDYEDVKYFGIDGYTDKQVDNQVQVLFYNSEEEYAVLLETKNGDEVILYKNPNGKTFEEIYNNLLKHGKVYKGAKQFKEKDQLKVPYIKMDEMREFVELEGKPFQKSTGEEILIDAAIQTIKFELDEQGGKIKSEAIIATKDAMAILPKEEEPRYFYFDDTFALFLKEESKDMPYFATLISDITKYQK